MSFGIIPVIGRKRKYLLRRVAASDIPPSMSEPERIYEMRRYPIGWFQNCENPSCNRRFRSKRKARFCSEPCRAIEHTRENRRAREIVRAQASAGRSDG